MLKQGRVRVNGSPCRRLAQPVAAGDIIQIGERTAPRKLRQGFKTVFEDEDLIIVEKPVGLLTVGTHHERERTAYAYLRDYVKLHSAKRKIFIVHRLDKFVSGLLVFAKSEETKAKLQAQFKAHSIQRKYWAIVEGRVQSDRGTIRSLLAEDQNRRMHSTEDPSSGKEAVTHYRVLSRLSNLTILEVRLETGRKNQIRAHLSEMGHPIVGDRAYGSRIDPMRRMGLHAFCLGFKHPRDGRTILFKTEPPSEFTRYLPPSAGERQ
jgi:23S rRNA pseudouridine1911/1915/1917 synthase